MGNNLTNQSWRWFEENLRRKVGDGTYTFFWKDLWLGELNLRDRFMRLFNLSENTWTTMTYMFSLGLSVGGVTLKVAASVVGVR